MAKVRALAVLLCVAVITLVTAAVPPAMANHSAQPGPYFPNQDIIVDMELYDSEHGWILENNGNVRAFGNGTAEAFDEPSFGFNIARALEIWYSGLVNGTFAGSGYVLNGYGELHRWVTPGAPVPPEIVHGPSWPGWDIARDFELVYDYSKGSAAAGFVLNGWGSIHPIASDFALIPQNIDQGPYWPGWDIARDLEAQVELTCQVSTGGHCGLVMDGWGALHPWSTEGEEGPAPVTNGPYWQGWDIARDFQIFYGGNGETEGWILNGWGGIHTWGDAPLIEDGPYWYGWDIARDFELFLGTGGVECEQFYEANVLDGWGARHPAHTTSVPC